MPPLVVYQPRFSTPTDEGSIPSGGTIHINNCMAQNGITTSQQVETFQFTPEQIEQFFQDLPPTGAGLPGFEVENVEPLEPNELDCGPACFVFEEQIYEWDGDITTEPVVIGDFGVTNGETVREYEAFGVKLNDADDVISVGIVLAVVGLIYIGKCCIDYGFNCAVERYKNKLNK